MNTYVVGHKNPDTDSVVSAIAYAELIGATPTVAGAPNKETTFLLKQFGFSVPGKLPEGEKKVFLVDTSNPDEFSENLNPTEVVGVVDHHKLGGLKTAEPIPVNIKTVGCTATVLAEIYKQTGREITKELAGIMLGAIISDTLKFTSPVTTDSDKETAEELAKKAAIEIDDLAKDMFAAKSDISDIPTEELIGKDYKEFSMACKKVGIGVWETTRPELIAERKQEILKELVKRKIAGAVDYIFFFCIDILNSKSTLFLATEQDEMVAKKAFEGMVSEQIMELPGVVSRKKQMTPIIEKALS